jgi:2-polyprenyl-6-methoxyphenol hydroxylase-like FAD-dependent oxidoreductase
MHRQQRAKIPRALIIGGGIAGLTTALALQQAGLTVRVFEQADASREEGAGIALWSNAAHVLTHLGCDDLLQSLGAPITQIVRYTPTGRILSAQPLGHLTSRMGIGSFAVHRAEFHRGLLQAVAPDTVSFQARCIRFRQDGGGVAVEFADGREAQGDLLIGADGIRSVIRTQMFGQRTLRYAGYTTIRGIASFEHPFLCPGKLFETWGRGSQFGAVRLTQGRVYWFLRLSGPARGAKREKAELQALCHTWHEPIEAIIAATEETALVQRDVYDCKPLSRWGQGAITLVGDAAHPITTSLAQGACQAIEDAGVLGSCLQADPVLPALCNYEQARIGRATNMVKLARRLAKLEQWDYPLVSWVRNLLVLRPPHAIQERFTQQIFGFRVSQ